MVVAEHMVVSDRMVVSECMVVVSSRMVVVVEDKKTGELAQECMLVELVQSQPYVGIRIVNGESHQPYVRMLAVCQAAGAVWRPKGCTSTSWSRGRDIEVELLCGLVEINWQSL